MYLKVKHGSFCDKAKKPSYTFQNVLIEWIGYCIIKLYIGFHSLYKPTGSVNKDVAIQAEKIIIIYFKF